MNVLVLSPIYPSPDCPQAGVFVHRQVAELVRLGVRCRVLTYRPAPPAFPRWLLRRSWLRYYWRRLTWPAARDGVPAATVFFRRTRQPGEDIVPAITEAVCRFLTAHPDWADVALVYAHWLWSAGAVALGLRERFGWPVAAIARGSELHDWHAVHPTCLPHVRRVLHEADAVLANCQDLRERAERLGPEPKKPIQVVYNGCDAERFRPAEDRRRVREALGLDPETPFFLFCGAVCRRKGVPELAEAWCRFAARDRDWRLVVVGPATEADSVARLREADAERILLRGEVPQDHVVRYLQAADAYLQPSRLEGLANATMEAMATGLPVITTDTCGQRELIEDGVNGWLVPPGDATALAAAMTDLAADRERARARGDAARRTIETRFNPRHEAARLAEILRRVKEESRRACPDRSRPHGAAVGGPTP
jgi:teichuronic acid biosynthesis glycosyltransferase TuaC